MTGAFIPNGAVQGFTQPADSAMEIGPETLVEQRPALTENRLAEGGD